ncbi:MAG: NUDIX hydrolase [Pseudohongiellaceae bacterium]|nr:NUDIX hydrolase [Pseudohongiellaceae bacterium]
MSQWHPHQTVATIVEKDNKFLLVEELIDGETVINQPAGHLEQNESLIDAAIRETFEETAWKVRPCALLGVYKYTAPSNQVTYIRTCFIAEAIEHIPSSPLDQGIIRAIWLSEQELEQRQAQLRSPLVLSVIKDYLAGKQCSLEFIQDFDATLS